MEFSHVTWRKASFSGSNSNCVEVGVWRKASYSTSNSNCVEVAGAGGVVGQRVVCLVRDSKDRGGSGLVFSEGAWDLFVATVKESIRG
jgi:Domain of unknown function (DUF397)